MNRRSPFAHRSLVLALGVFALGGSAGSSSAVTVSALPHTRLVKAEPGKDSTVSVAPKELRLFFSETVKPSVAGVRLLASDSSVIAIGALKTGEGTPAPIVAPVTGAIKAGTYRVMWRVAGADGHPISGNYVFTVKLR